MDQVCKRTFAELKQSAREAIITRDVIGSWGSYKHPLKEGTAVMWLTDYTVPYYIGGQHMDLKDYALIEVDNLMLLKVPLTAVRVLVDGLQSVRELLMAHYFGTC